MGEFCDDVRTLIGEQLHIIGATHIKDTVSGEGMDETEVCFFSASDKIIAIPHSTRDGTTCFIHQGETAELSQYETWDTLWHLLEMDKHFFESDEGMNEYIAMFPDTYEEMIRFTGTCLVKYFESHR